MNRWIILLFAVAISATRLSQDVQSIIQQSVEATQRDWRAAPDYDYFQRVRTDGGTKTYDVRMTLGSPYERLTAVNNKPLTASQEAEEQQKLDQEMSQRRSESSEERNHRIAKYIRERQRDHLLVEQLTRAFEFTLEGEQRLGARDVYVLRARPRAGYRPPSMQAEVLTGMQGKLWVDKSTFQWVRVEAEVIHPVTIEGFLAQVEPGTHFELEKAPVDDGIWLPKHFSMRSRSKIVFLIPHKTQEEETYWGYRKMASQQGH